MLSIIKQLEATDSTNEKEAILRANADSTLLQDIFKLAYSKRITFGITRMPSASAGMGMYTLQQALDILMSQFATRVLTGNAAVTAMESLCNALSKDDFEVFKRVVKRDLECGTSVAIANKVWPGLIPEQPQYLAASYSEKNLKNIVYPAYAQLKADGARCMACIDEDGNVQLYSRGGNEYLGLTNIVDALLKTGARNVMIDGELIHVPPAPVAVSFDIFALDEADVDEDYVPDEAVNDRESERTKSNGLANKSLKGTISHQEQSEMVFNVWDIVDLDVYWGRAPSTVQYKDRFAELERVVKDIPQLRLIESQVVYDLEEAKQIYYGYIQQQREGIILKNMHGLWQDARSTDQIKFKEEIEFDVVIIDVYAHKKDPNKLGGITVRDATGHVEFDCGSGFKDKTHKKVGGKKVYIPLEERHEYDRELLMSQAASLIGTIAQIKCNGLLRAKNRAKGEPGEFKVFLPVFQLLRHDKHTPNDYMDVFEFIPD